MARDLEVVLICLREVQTADTMKQQRKGKAMGMLRSRKNVGKHNLACYYGCCRYAGAGGKKYEKRVIKRSEKREWKRDADSA